MPAWKASIRQKRIGGSNPPLSAILKVIEMSEVTLLPKRGKGGARPLGKYFIARYDT